jgi:hypothetical protein
MTKGKNRCIKFEKIWAWENLLLADERARRHKSRTYGVRKFDREWWKNMTDLQQSFINRTYKCMLPVLEERICEHKNRSLAKVFYYYNVAHHAVMNICEPIIRRSLYYDSSASIKGKGISHAVKRTRKYIDLHPEPLWWTQIDFVKFYHNINRQRLYEKLCKLFHDKDIRWHLHDIIWALGNHNGIQEDDGTKGLGIGLFPIQMLANFHLNDLDRELARLPGIRNERYCDNILIMGDSPEAVQNAIDFTIKYAREDLQQPLHENIGIQKLSPRQPIDFVGYKFYRTHTYVRSDTKYRFKRKFNNTKDPEKRLQMLSSYKGWLMQCDGLHLWQKTTGMKKFSDLNIKQKETMRDGHRYFEVPTVNASVLVDRTIIVKDFEEHVQTKNGKDRMCVLVEENGTEKKFLTNNPKLKDTLLEIREMGELPFEAILRSKILNGSKINYYFE